MTFPNACIACFDTAKTVSEHDHSYTTTPLLVHIVLGIDSASNRKCSVIEKIVVQLTISRSKLLPFEEQGIIQEGQRIEDIKIELLGLVSLQKHRRCLHTFLARIKASLMRLFNRSFRPFSFSSNAVAEA